MKRAILKVHSTVSLQETGYMMQSSAGNKLTTQNNVNIYGQGNDWTDCVSAVTNSSAGKYKSIHMENGGREERRRRIRCSSALHLRYMSLSRGCNPAYFHICRYITCPACINTSDLQYCWEKKPVMHQHPPPRATHSHISKGNMVWNDERDLQPQE